MSIKMGDVNKIHRTPMLMTIKTSPAFIKVTERNLETLVLRAKQQISRNSDFLEIKIVEA